MKLIPADQYEELLKQIGAILEKDRACAVRAIHVRDLNARIQRPTGFSSLPHIDDGVPAEYATRSNKGRMCVQKHLLSPSSHQDWTLAGSNE
jgi:hypothetical protein